jgi:primosomal protein N'
MCGAGMVYNKRDAFLRCPDCGSEFWPFVGGGTTKDVVREEFEKDLPCARTKDVGRGMHHVKSKKSSSKSSSGRKPESKKKSTTAIYKELASQPNKIKLRKITLA